ncbi:nicotinate-nucleotide adenylyltransferase [Clostridium ganghwense]|uniref:Probable nicotinate-nucleotide adenylyltransferase n=1 Tax=Clostridium ganghwense TaxID=312089 RepID=A0ABT4CSF9_9CLOT|nr:nicotinate-nucleotide adenylyltransferase [Clostridium ganghwense]MCY6371853.1 nicotinate-nucleotide adenylyltransferase [Clostridium ganghwense]
MNKNGIFGGTFDPIHNGHLHIAYEALYRLGLEKVIFIPAGNPPHKTNKGVTDAEVRFQLVKKTIEKEKKFEVSDYEIKKKNLSYTYETLKHFKLLQSQIQWYFITGVDCLMEIDSWKNVKEILDYCKFVVFNRPGYTKEDIIRQKNSIEKKYNKEIIFLDIPILEISSTQIREKIKKGENVSYLIPEKLNYLLTDMKLYR